MERRKEWCCQTLFDSRQKELLALDRRLSMSLLTVASPEMTLPRYVNCSTALRLVPSMLILGGLQYSRQGG